MTAHHGDIYYVYGRKAFDDPLAFVAQVAAGEVEALATAEADWVELVAFPQSAVIRVIPWEGEDEYTP